MSDLVQTIDPAPYILACWVVSALLLGGAMFFAYKQWRIAKRDSK